MTLPAPVLTPGHILVVDDEPSMVRLLTNMLRHDGHVTRTASNGQLGMADALAYPPDLILTDVNMPVMDGYEFCARLKADPRLREIPVIFVSAMPETLDKVRAFGSGAVDYLTKPFQFGEMRARVTAHLKIRGLQKQLAQHNAQLESLVQLRTQQLAEANARLSILDAAKNDFLNLISHELRTPLNGILGSLELLIEDVSQHSQQRDLLECFEQSRRRLVDILDGALLLTQIGVESSQVVPKPVLLAPLLALVRDAAGDFAQSREVVVTIAASETLAVMSDADLLRRALLALLKTAVRFAAPGTTVRLSTVEQAGDAAIVFTSTGRSIPPQHVARFFDIFSISEPITPGGDLGLEPPMAQRIVALFGGTTEVENLVPAGIRLRVTLRRASAPSA